MFQVYFDSIKVFVTKYTSSILGTHFWNRFVFFFWLRSILEVDFWNLFIYCQTQKYTWSRLSKLRHLFSNSQLYFKYTSFQKKSRSVSEVLLEYKQSAFLVFPVFILHLYFFLGSSLKAYLYWTSWIWSINEVCLNCT